MTPEEFMLSVKPDLLERRAASRLEPHRDAIEKLRGAGYSLRLVAEYLEKCGVKVSIQMLSKFLRGPSVSRSRATQATPTHPRPTESAGPLEPTKSREQLLSENPGVGKREIEQMYVDQFQTTQPNPLLRRRKSI